MRRMQNKLSTAQRRLLPPLLSTLLATAAAAGCTTQTAYQTGQEWQRQQCLKLQDRDERQRCEKSNATSYERYREEAEAARHSAPPPPR
jgi:phage terminase small subunit